MLTVHLFTFYYFYAVNVATMIPSVDLELAQQNGDVNKSEPTNNGGPKSYAIFNIVQPYDV